MAKEKELILAGLKGILHVELIYKDDRIYQIPQINNLKKIVIDEAKNI